MAITDQTSTAPTVAHLRDHSLTGVVQHEIERMILSGAFPAGSRLNENARHRARHRLGAGYRGHNQDRAVASALGRWLSNADRRTAAGRHNRRAAADRFSWRASAQSLLDVYRRVVAERAGRAHAARASA